MIKNSLFGHISLKLSSQTENIATEGLNFILNRSKKARISLIEFLNVLLGTTLGSDIRFEGQKHGEDNSIPDLVGIDKKGNQSLIIEAKFWAGLMDSQPVTYLQRLPDNEPGVLLFIAPEMRLTSLWHELLRRCNQSELCFDCNDERSDFLSININKSHILALTSWRLLLDRLKTDMFKFQEHEVVSDITQLIGLTERMDADAILPIKPEELSGNIPNRIQQFSGLIDEMGNVAVSRGYESPKGSSHFNWKSRNLLINSYEFWFYLDIGLWAYFGTTPFWLNFGREESINVDIREKLSTLKNENPPRLQIDMLNRWVVPLYPECGVEKDKIVDSMLDQIEEVANLIAP